MARYIRGSRTWVTLVAVAAATALLAAACAAEATPVPTPVLKLLRIGSGSVGGDWFAWGQALQQVLSKALDTRVESQPTEGSSANIRLLRRGEVDVGVVYSSTGQKAFKGLDPFDKEAPYTELRLLAGLHSGQHGTLVLARSGMTEFREIAGKKVCIGPSPAVSDVTPQPIYEAHGIDFAKGIEKVYASYDDCYRLLGDGTVDGLEVGISALSPEPGLLELGGRAKIRFLSFDRAALAKACEAGAETCLPFVIPGDAGFPGVEVDTLVAAGAFAILQTTKDLSDDVAYIIVKALHENLEGLTEFQPAAREAMANPEILTRQSPGMEYHPGAIKYWREVGLWTQY